MTDTLAGYTRYVAAEQKSMDRRRYKPRGGKFGRPGARPDR